MPSWTMLESHRRNLLTNLYYQFEPPDQDLEELLDDPERFVVIERYPISGHHYISHHPSLEVAGKYVSGQDDQGWYVLWAEDLDHNIRYDAIRTTTWKRRA